MKTLGKKEVADVIAVKMYGSKPTVANFRDVESAFCAYLDYLESGLAQNFKIHFKKFGALVPKFKSARMGRNPKTLEPHKIDPRVTVTLLPRSYARNETEGRIGLGCMKEEMRKHFITANEAALFVDYFNDLLNGAVENETRFEFRGFGTFNHKLRKARMAVNPKTLEKTLVGEKVVLNFKVSKKMVIRLTEKMGPKDA